jgi:molybdenum cofactor cytidylyltransferase
MICGIVLAAGQSRRMGTQKLLLPWAGKTVIAHIVDETLAAGIDRVLVVVSSDADRIAQALASRPVTFVTNPNPEGDMLSSIRCGLRALPSDCEAALVVLGDQPRIDAELIKRVLRAKETSGRGIALPIADGKRGHPIAVAAQYFPEVLSKFDGVGLHGLVDAHPNDLVTWPITESLLLADMDFPEDYERHRAAQEKQPKEISD